MSRSRAVGEPGALAERDEAVVVARGDDFESALAQERREALADVERDVFLADRRRR